MHSFIPLLRGRLHLPSAATAASKPSSSSPGISLLRLRLGGREPVGDTTAQTTWKKKVQRMLIFKDSIKDAGFQSNCSTCSVALSCHFRVVYNSIIVSPTSGQRLYYTGYLAKYNGMHKVSPLPPSNISDMSAAIMHCCCRLEPDSVL